MAARLCVPTMPPVISDTEVSAITQNLTASFERRPISKSFSDRTIYDLQGRTTFSSEQERLFMVKSVSFIKGAFISSGSGILDFEAEIRAMIPDYCIVNAGGHISEKRDLCRELGIEYIILERKPHLGHPVFS